MNYSSKEFLDLNQKYQLLKLAESVELFCDKCETAYARFKKNNHFEVWSVESPQFKEYLNYKYYKATKSSPSNNSLKEAIGTLKSKAKYEGECKSVARRITNYKGHILIDLCDEQWRVIDVSPDGWYIKEESPVPFVRSTEMKPLPQPVKGGSIEELKPFINVSSDSDFRLIVAWLLAAFRLGYPFPILILKGEQGSGKTTAAKSLRSLIDPSEVSTSGKPKSEEDLWIHASNSWVVSFDNLSGKIKSGLSDVFCQISTGGGNRKRKLYTDTDEVIIKVMRPVLLNGIDFVVRKGDLQDRSIVLELPPIINTNKEFKTEQHFWEEFEEAKPRILGAILDILSAALAKIDRIRSSFDTRMADFVRWITAAEEALGWPEGQFYRDYKENKSEAIEILLSDDPLAQGVIALAEDKKHWVGSATELLINLKEKYLSRSESKNLSTPNWVGRRLNQLKPLLRKQGIHVKKGKRDAQKNKWIISRSTN